MITRITAAARSPFFEDLSVGGSPAAGPLATFDGPDASQQPMKRRGLVLLLGAAALCTACSAFMDDLSLGPPPAEQNARIPRRTEARDAGTSTSSESLETDGELVDDGGAVVDQDDDGGTDYQLPSTDAGTLQTGCQLVTFAPTIAQNEGVGNAWRDPLNARVDDGKVAIVTLNVNARESQSLFVGGLSGPTIPATATIKGILVDVERTSGTCIYAKSIAFKHGTTVRTKTIAGDWDGVALYGGLDDLWGTAPIPSADFGVPTTGVAIAVRFQGTCRAREGRVDAVRVRVHYCM